MALETKNDTLPVDAIAKLAQAAVGEVKIVPLPTGMVPYGSTVEEPHIAIVRNPSGTVEIKALDTYVSNLRGKPAQRLGTATATTLESFIELVRRHGDQNSAVFVDANWRAPSMTAVIDYNCKRDGEPRARDPIVGDDHLARFGRHRITYAFPLSEAWQIWVANSGTAMLQAAFASFLEDHIHELSAPFEQEVAEVKHKFKVTLGNPTTILDLSRELEVTAGSRVKSKKRLESGEQALAFEVEHTDTRVGGQSVEVPGMFLINVPVFYRGEPTRVLARLRYRTAGDNGLVWFYDLHRPDEVVDTRVRDDVDRVASATGLPVYDGTPEA